MNGWIPDVTDAVQYGPLEVVAVFALVAYLGMRLERLLDRWSFRRTARRAR